MKALVVYGSERGGTAGLADMVAEAFRREGWEAEVRDAAAGGGSVSDADAIVVGGALYMNRWHAEARKFVQRNHDALAAMPVWLFSSGPLDESARPGDIAPVTGVQELARRIEARGHMTFGGRLAPDAKGFIASRMAKKYAGDWRDPQHVREWVHQIIHDFVPVEAVVPAAQAAGEARIPAQRSRQRATSPTS